MKTGNVKIPGALTATNIEKVVAYAGDIRDEITRPTLENPNETSTNEISQHDINLELISWKDSVVDLTTPDEYDFTNYYDKNTIEGKLNNKVNTSSVIQRAIDDYNQPTINFSVISTDDYTNIPSVAVFKALVSQVESSDNITNALNSYGINGILNDKIGFSLSKCLTSNSIIDLIAAARTPLANDYGDYSNFDDRVHSSISLNYFDSLIYGNNGLKNFSYNGSIVDYVKDSRLKVYEIVTELNGPDNNTIVGYKVNGESVTKNNFITSLYSLYTTDKRFIIVCNNTSDNQLFLGIIDRVTSNSADFIFNTYNIIDVVYYINLSQLSESITQSTGIEVKLNYLQDLKFKVQTQNSSLIVSNSWDSGIDSIENIISFMNRSYIIPMEFESKTYYPSSINYENNKYFITYHNILENQGYNFSIVINTSNQTCEVAATGILEALGGLLTGSLNNINIDVVIGLDIVLKKLPQDLSWLHNNLIYDILLDSDPFPKEFGLAGVQVDLDEKLKANYIKEKTSVVQNELITRNGNSASVGDNYKYDFTGNGTIDSSNDFESYLSLRNNLVVEVNGLIRKLANINPNTSYATTSSLETLASKVYAGLYGNSSTTTSNLTDNTELQSLKAVVNWIGANGKQYGSVAALITDKVAALQDDILGTYGNNGVLESAGTENNIKLGVKFNDNIGALNKIATLEGYTTVDEGYVIGIGPGTDSEHEEMSIFDYLMELDNTAIPDAGTVAAAIISATGYAPGSATLGSRISTLESFKNSFIDNLEILHNGSSILTDISNLNETIDNITNSYINIIPFNRFLTNLEENSVQRPGLGNITINTPNDIYYSKALGIFVAKSGNDYYQEWNHLNSKLNQAYYNDTSNRYFYVNNIGEVYQINPEFSLDVTLPYLITSYSINDILSQIDNSFIETVSHAITEVLLPVDNNTETTDDDVDHIYGPSTLDLTGLATKGYVDNILHGLEGLNNLTGDQINTLVDLAENGLSGYARTSDLANYIKGIRLVANGTPKIPDSNGYVTLNGVALTSDLDSYLLKNLFTWDNLSGRPTGFITKVTEDMVSSLGFTKNEGTVKGIRVNGTSKTIDNNGNVDIGYFITKITYTVDGSPKYIIPNSTNGTVFDLGNIISDIPNPEFSIYINGQPHTFDDDIVYNNDSTSGFNLGNNFIKGKLLDASDYDYINNELSEEPTEDYSEFDPIVTLSTLQHVVGYYLKPASSGYVGNDFKVESRTNVTGSGFEINPNYVTYYTQSVVDSNFNTTNGLAIHLKYADSAKYTVRFTTSSSLSSGKFISIDSLNNSNSPNGLITFYANQYKAKEQGRIQIAVEAGLAYEIEILKTGTTCFVKVFTEDNSSSGSPSPISERNSGIALYTNPLIIDGKTTLKENSLTLWTSQSLTSLNLNFDHTNGVDAAVYSLRFKTGISFTFTLSDLGVNDTVLYPYDLTWNTNTDYEVSILYHKNGNYGTYSIKLVALLSLTINSNNTSITIG